MTAINFKLLSLALNEICIEDLNKLKLLIDSRIKSESKKSISQRSSIEIPLSKPSKAFDKSLSSLVNDDWSHLFSSYSSNGNNFYVYFHGRPNSDRRKYKSLGCVTFTSPFYVGVGQGDRAYNFKRTSIHQKKLSDLVSKGFAREDIVHIVKREMSEAEARELESKLIVYFGINTGSKKNSKERADLGLCRPSLLNLKYEPTPEVWDVAKY